MKTCVFAGTFDPITVGHKDVIDKALKIFDKVIVALLVNPEKSPYFTLEERKALLSKLYENDNRIEIESFDGMLVDFMKLKGANVFVRGVRNGADYKYESAMNDFNTKIYPELLTVFLPTDEKLKDVSSTKVKEIIKLKKPLNGYVPEGIVEEVKRITELKQK